MIKPEELVKRALQPDIELNVVNHNSISSVFKSGDRYMIYIKNILNQDLIRYFLLWGTSLIIEGLVENGEEPYFSFDYSAGDLSALSAYNYIGFDIKSLKKSVLFEDKVNESSFNRLMGEGINYDKT